MRKLVSTIVLFVIFFLPIVVHAEEPTTRTSYKAEYFLQEQDKSLKTRVKFTITSTNLRTDIYVKKIALIFPKSFTIENMKATDDIGPVYPDIISDDTKSKITLEFNEPAIGKNTKNNFYLNFDQTNLFEVNGNIWEVLLPTMDDKTRSTYSVIVHLPETTDKKITISKPKPDKIENNTIYWDNPSTKTIYAVFGAEQFYSMKLAYHLENPKLAPVYTDIALPPDTLYQKIYLGSLLPQPAKILTDEDGNLLARYILKPTEKITIQYVGTAQIFSKTRADMQQAIDKQFQTQKKYLLSKSEYWNSPPTLDKQTIKEIYNSIVEKFTYDYSKINKTSQRLGAAKALNSPSTNVCTEYADTFVSLARSNGIYAREIQGYGFSQDEVLRPQSLSSDILHSWPEYYDATNAVWTPVDPTWEDTSGIDYFDSFDLNHIVFAIHGKEADYPYPAGSYKSTNSKDVSIVATTDKPQERIKLELENISLPSRLTDNQKYKTTIKLVNKSNVYVWDTPLRFESKFLNIFPKEFNVASLAPLEEKEIEISYSSAIKNRKDNATITYWIDNNKIAESTTVIWPYYFTFALYSAYVLAGLCMLLVVLLVVENFFHRKHTLIESLGQG